MQGFPNVGQMRPDPMLPRPNLPGLIGLTTGGQGPSPVSGTQIAPTAAPPIPQAPAAIPGVSGITPGAIERRLAMPPTQQANENVGMAPTQQAMSLGNTVGADPSSIQDPVMLIQALLQKARGGA